MITLPQECNNLIFSYMELESLKTSFFTSRHFLSSINEYASAILMNFKLEATDPTFSFKRLCNLQNLINQWKRSQDYQEPDLNYYPNCSIEESTEQSRLIFFLASLDIATNTNQFYLLKHYLLQDPEKKVPLDWIQHIHHEIKVDTYFNIPDCRSSAIPAEHFSLGN